MALHIGTRSLAGHTRLFLTVMDILKGMGDDVVIYDRFRGKTVSRIGNATFTQQLDSQQMHYDIRKLRDYFPLKHLAWQDVHFDDIPAAHFGSGIGYPPFSERVMEALDGADLIFTDCEALIQLPTTVRTVLPGGAVDYAWRWAPKMVQYVHYPASLPPNGNPDYQPREILTNSEFSRKAIREKWGFDAKVLYPPIYCDLFDHSREMKERKYDLVFYARLGRDKFAQFADITARLPRKRVAVIGSNYGLLKEKPHIFSGDRVELFENATFQVVRDVLADSRVYVHLKGLETDREHSEHFGQSIQDAVASGCLSFVPSTPSGSHEIPTVRIYDDVVDLVKQIKALDVAELEEWREERVKAVSVNDPINRIKEFESAFRILN